MCLFFLTKGVFAQRNVRDSVIGTPWVAITYGSNWSGGDLLKKYGYLNHLGFLAGYKTKKNVFIGLDGNFIFGRDIRITGLFDGLKDSYGNITDINGDIATILLFSRGFNTNITFGKILPVFSPNANSGIFLQGGFGLLAHKIRIESNSQVIPSLELDYKKGYDRLCMGPNIHEFIGYSFMANRGVFNFYGGFYAQQGFTKNMRTIFFDQPDVPVSKKTQIDLQFGLKIGWLIPIYKRLPKDYYYN